VPPRSGVSATERPEVFGYESMSPPAVCLGGNGVHGERFGGEQGAV